MAAQDAQLLLKVGLDLSTFRNQLTTLGQAAAGYNLPIKLQFGRKALQDEVKYLREWLGKKKFNIELNIVGGLTKDQFEKIQARLDTLSKTKKVEIPVSIKNGATGKDVADTLSAIKDRIASSQQVKQGGGKLRVPLSIKPSITNADVADFKNAIKSKLSGISVKVKAEVQGGSFAQGTQGAAGLYEYMRSQGMSGGNMPGATEVGRSERLRKALEERTVKQLKDLAAKQGIGGVSKLNKDPLIAKLVAELSQDVAENLLGNIKNQMRDVGKTPIRRSFLDQIARAVLYMAGVDPASIRAQQAERRRIPAINWPATVPPVQPVSTRTTMALTGRTFNQLPGTAYGEQKRLVGNILNEGLKDALRNAANSFVDSVRDGLNAAIRAVQVRDLGNTGRPMLGAGRVAGLLTPFAGREPQRYSGGGESREQMMARRTAEAYARSALRSVDVIGGGGGRPPAPYSQAYRGARPLSAIVPYQAAGAIVPAGGGAGGGGGGTPPARGGRPSGGGGNFFGGMAGLSLPGAGTIRELGSEFAFATKQVLLFGQAYKLLAFVQDFPAQVGQAVGQLQSFRNTLNAISPSAAEAAKSNEFILSIVDKYNVPIQSARDGFTKLYASMEPAGFRGEEIRGLFESISMGAATFGMSADKVDRVIYAFSQMASKGQVMSEELKGQLGDVLPGSMALFAEAAGFKGPDAISKFSKALEDGVYKGQNMVKLLKNVRVVMEQEFGPGAEGAALTFQGGINRMQNSLRQLYEAFEPVAVNFMNQVVKPLTDGLRTAADGFTAFLQGVAAKTPQGAAFAQELERLRPALEGIGNNLKGLLPTFELFGNILLNVGKLLLAIAGNPITGFLLKVYANVLLVNTVFSLLGGKILIGLISNIGAAIARFIALNIQMGLLQKTTAVANSSLAGTQLQMALLTRNAGAALGPIGLLKTALTGLARIGLIAIAIQVAIDGMAEIDRLKKSLDDIAGFSSKEYKKQVQGLSREEVNSRIIVNRRSQVQARKDLQGFTGPLGAARGLITGRDEELRARLVKYQIQEAVLQGARGNKTQSQLMRSQLGGALEPVTGGGEGGTKGGRKGAGDKAARAAERAAQQARELEATLQQLREQLNIEKKSLELQEAIAFARADGNEKLVGFLETQEKFYDIDEKNTKLQKDFAAGKIKQAELSLRQQLLAIDRKKVEITEEERLNAVLRDRFGITNEMMDAARRARENAFGLGLGGASTFRTDINLDPSKKQTALDSMQQRLTELIDKENQARLGAEAIGSAFGTAFKDVVSGSKSAQDALASMMQSIADHFLDMAAQIIAQQLTMMIYGVILKALGVMGGASGIFGPKGAPDFTGQFGSVPGTSFGGALQMPKLAANGAVWKGGFQAFANGGMVTGPTLGLIGEGKYNEAIVPLPDGRSIPVQLQSDSIRDKMGGGMTGSYGMPSLSMSFETTTINGVEYVSRDQLEAAMMETRKLATADGAQKGANLAIDKLQQSPSVRRRVGIR